jgi:CheY-like chemotaxis protein
MDAALPAAGEGRPMSSATTRPVFTILVADDDPTIVAMLGVLFEQEGHRVLAANDGPKALQSCEEDSVDLAILDVAPAGFDGVEVAKALRGRAGTFSIPIVFCTGTPELVPARFSDPSRGNVRIVRKPFQLGELRDAVLGLLSFEQAARDLFASASRAPTD